MLLKIFDYAILVKWYLIKNILEYRSDPFKNILKLSKHSLFKPIKVGLFESSFFWSEGGRGQFDPPFPSLFTLQYVKL